MNNEPNNFWHQPKGVRHFAVKITISSSLKNKYADFTANIFTSVVDTINKKTKVIDTENNSDDSIIFKINKEPEENDEFLFIVLLNKEKTYRGNTFYNMLKHIETYEQNKVTFEMILLQRQQEFQQMIYNCFKEHIMAVPGKATGV